MTHFEFEGSIFEKNELWFDGHIPNWTRILGHYRDQPTKYLEIGSYKGRSLCWMLLHILQHEESTATSIDPFTGSMEHLEANGGKPLDYFDIFQHNINATQYGSKVRVFKDYSQNILIDLLGDQQELQSFDVIYIDGSHTSYDVLRDAIMSWPLLKLGGYLIFDDYLWQCYKDKPQLNPKLAIDSFCKCYIDFVDVVLAEWQVCVRKKSSKIPS